MKLHLQVTEQATSSDLEDLRAKARSLGATDLRALFPGDPAPALRRLFVVDAPDTCDEAQLLDALGKEAAVHFVEPQARRRLVRPRLARTPGDGSKRRG
jgi:hypothetical protein